MNESHTHPTPNSTGEGGDKRGKITGDLAQSQSGENTSEGRDHGIKDHIESAGQDPDVHLKTLDDLEEISTGGGREGYCDCVIKSEVRLAGIEYYKDLQKRINQTNQKDKISITRGELAKAIMKSVQNFIKNFMNLTKEEIEKK